MSGGDKKKEFEDFQYQAAGIANGRIQRTDSKVDELTVRRKRDQETRRTIEMTNEAEREVTRFLNLMERLKQAIADTRNELDVVKGMRENMERDAPMLDDGRRVFFARDGKAAYDQTGQKISAGDLDKASVTFDPTKPSYEDYQEVMGREKALTGYLDTLEQEYSNAKGTTPERTSSSKLDDLEALLNAGPPENAETTNEMCETASAPPPLPAPTN